LEAPVSGSKQPAIDGQLIILAAGDAHLYKAALPAFQAMGKRSFLLDSSVGAGARMKLIVNGIMGAMMAALSEGMALTGACGLVQKDLLEILDLGAMSNPMFRLKGGAMAEGSFPPAFPLKHQQKDLRLALALSDEMMQPVPVLAAVNEVYKRAKGMGLSDNDFSAVYEAVKANDVARPVLKKGLPQPESMESLNEDKDRSVPQGMD
jgi:glyoxylate/succinic semialdehyde reductase